MLYQRSALEIIGQLDKSAPRLSADKASELAGTLSGEKLSRACDKIAGAPDMRRDGSGIDVLIYNFDCEVEQEALPKMPKHYCVVYSYYNRIHTAEEIDAIKEFCKRHELTPIAIGAPQFWIEDYIVCSPFQCLKIFKESDFVITDTFHGTIFASKYADKFAVLARASNKNKLLDLVGKIEMKEHLMSDLSELEEKYGLLKNKENFNLIIERETQRSIQYLTNNI